MDETYRSPQDYLRRPYARVLTPDEEGGAFTAEILEFPGCIAQGDTPEEAYRNLESAAAGWVEAALDMGQKIPEPSDPYSHSGRIALRLPRGLHRRAAQMAEREGTSLNQFLVGAIAERVGAESFYTEMAQRLEQLATRPTASGDALVPRWVDNDYTTARFMVVRGPALLGGAGRKKANTSEVSHVELAGNGG